MSDTHIYCCEQCGEIFEDIGDPQLCPSCRKSIEPSRTKVVTFERRCAACGRRFASRSHNTQYCNACRTITRDKQKKEWDRDNQASKPRRRTAQPKAASIGEICKRAAAMHMTYGEYVAKFKE